LSPSIFRKIKGPLILGSGSISSGTTSTSSESTIKTAVNGGKRVEGVAGLKEFTISDFDIN
jgi:hypothetical protein